MEKNNFKLPLFYVQLFIKNIATRTATASALYFHALFIAMERCQNIDLIHIEEASERKNDEEMRWHDK